MIIKLLDDIISYIEYLKKQGFYITIHDRNDNFCNYMYIISKYNIHNNLYCLAIKSNESAWQHCISRQWKIYKHLEENGPFWGMCYAGVEEYIFPIKNEEILGFISVSGYGVNLADAFSRIDRISKEYSISKQNLKQIYYENLIHTKPIFSEINCLIQPLCYMLLYLYEFTPKKALTKNNEDIIYSLAINFINKNYANKISLSDISKHCNYSDSSISHTFKKRSGYTISEYINKIRMIKAQKLLLYSSFTINDIAYMVGFSDSNYFITVFKQHFGLSPAKYRKSNN